MTTKNILYTVIFFLICINSTVSASPISNSKDSISIIPQPLNTYQKKGDFKLTPSTIIQTDVNDAQSLSIGKMLSDNIYEFTKQRFPVKDLNGKQQRNVIILKIDKHNQLGEEGYNLLVSSNKINLTSSNPHGLFYAMETLIQLLPAKPSGEIKISGVAIEDKPRYPHRGMLLDVGRTFYSVDFVKKFIDYLAFHKMNTFHWHLTEDQGWRIEIKRYPKLTQVGAWRDGTLIGKLDDLPHRYDGKRTGGFYTQDQIKDIVAYAKQRFIEVIPEIEMPGHAQAALAAYSALSCSGGPFEVSQLWGVRNDIYCAGNEQTFTFLEDVLTEICDLFPSQYIHIGGDECPKIRWENCAKCQARMKSEGLTNEAELQNYFINRIAKFLQTKNKKIIGWDEILNPGISESATIMSWRGTKGGIAAAKSKHNVIMAPESMVYFDYYQGDPSLEPVAIGGLTTLQKVYNYDPTPKELDKDEQKYIQGAEGALWTEYVTSPAYAEYMLMPRMAALAEIMWTTDENKNWESFKQRMEQQYNRYDILKINYSKSAEDVQQKVSVDLSKLSNIALFTNSYQPEIYYTLDGNTPTVNSKKYSDTLRLKPPYLIKAANFKNDVIISKVSTFQQN
ncbi:beta-N-acetylhexosaminidase [Mucilaginibacter sp.]